jgi:hypothetical protein
MLDDCRTKFFFAAKVVIKRTFRDINRIKNFLSTGAVIALVHEKDNTLVQEAFSIEFFFIGFWHTKMIRLIVSKIK